MLWAVLFIFALGGAAPRVARRWPRSAGWILAAPLAVLTAFLVGRISEVAQGDLLRESLDWIPSLQVTLSFRLDGLSLLFAILISLIGTLIIVYSGGYLKGDPRLGRFLSFLLLFMASMLGLVLADHLLTMFVFWELTSVTSFLLIGFDHEDPRSRRSALQALLVTGGGGLAMLAGLVWMALLGESWELSDLLVRGDLFRDHPAYGAILALILLGAFSKSSQFPFHFWLPNAMDAPTPVSAFLHSATMVKAGVYLLARLHPVLGGTDLWAQSLVIAGGLTALLGALAAVGQDDLKRLLAYTTVAALGQMVLLLGLGTEHALEAFAVSLLAHALYKGALFMGAGAVDHETGTRSLSSLGGLGGPMPWVAGAVGLAAWSNAGLPPALGFIGKEVLYQGVLESPGPRMIIAGGMVVVNGLLMVAAGRVFLRPFLGPRTRTPREPHEAPPALLLGPLSLAVLGLLFGVGHGLLGPSLVAATVSGVAGEARVVELHLLPGLNGALALSVGTLVLGVLFYPLLPRILSASHRLGLALPLRADPAWDAALRGLVGLAEWQTRLLQGGVLRSYLRTTIAFVTLAVGGTMLARGALPETWPALGAPPIVWLLSLLIAASVAVTLLAHVATTAILSLGVLGLAIALLFLQFGAPDVAMTQFLVETLIVIIVALVLHRLPSLSPFRASWGRERLFNMVVALAFGVVVTGVALSLTSIPFDPFMGQFFVERSVPEGHGRNIVNVILVDFRAMDTLGEILVVSIAGLGSFSLLRMRRGGQ